MSLPAKFRTWVKENPSLPWVLGQWSDILLGGELPNRDWVDDASQDKPLFLARFDMHSAVANSRALEIAGIGRNTPDPSGGRIVRHPRTGEPTGLLLEKAMDLVADKIPPLTDSQKGHWLENAFQYAHRLGLTAVHDVFFHSKWEDLDIYRQVLQKEKAGVRVYLRVSLGDLDRFLSALEGAPPGSSHPGRGEGVHRRHPRLHHRLAGRTLRPQSHRRAESPASIIPKNSGKG